MDGSKFLFLRLFNRKNIAKLIVKNFVTPKEQSAIKVQISFQGGSK